MLDTLTPISLGRHVDARRGEINDLLIHDQLPVHRFAEISEPLFDSGN